MAEHAHSITASTSSRRGFLRGLTTLPLIGGSVALIGSPTKADVPTTDELLDGYDEWLYFERKLLHIERFGKELAKHTVHCIPCTPANQFHFPNWPIRWQDIPQPSTRAALVLSAVGCDWQGGARG